MASLLGRIMVRRPQGRVWSDSIPQSLAKTVERYQQFRTGHGPHSSQL